MTQEILAICKAMGAEEAQPMDGILSQRLLSDVKNALDITWDDPGTDRKLQGFTESGVNYLDSKAGERLEYTRGSGEWALLMEFVRYARDGALDVFENNYRHLLLAMQHERMMRRASNALETRQSDIAVF